MGDVVRPDVFDQPINGAIAMTGIISKFLAMFRREPITPQYWDGLSHDPCRETKRRLRAEIARLKRNKKRHSHLIAELDRLNGV